MLTTQIEAILLATAKPTRLSSLGKLLGEGEGVIREAVDDIVRRFNVEGSGIHLQEHDGAVQLVTNPSAGKAVAKALKTDMGGELTRPSLETLTIIAYRGPVTKPEIEQIRGVNCSLILRNLMVRGLIDEVDDVERLQPAYTVSAEFMRHLGLHDLSELPKYEELHENERITELIEELAAAEDEPAV